MKKLIPAYVLSFVLVFMLFYYEPITMYMLNFHDFWFDMSIIHVPLLITCFGLFFGLSLLFTAIYFINKKVNNKTNIYNICVIVFFVVFICTYIQGNYMSNNLPSLDGSDINWNDYNIQGLISIIMWIVVITGTVFACAKCKIENVVKTTPFIAVAVFIMLISSFIASIRPHAWDQKILTVSTTKNYNTASTDKNFYIFMLDTIDSKMFDDVMVKSNKESVFNDFTYFKDTTSTYAYTRDSVPFVLSGVWNENTQEFKDYYNDALDKAILFDKLKEEDYDINIYDNDISWSTKKADNVSNLIKLNRKIDNVNYMKQQTKYVLFKYLPFPLKRFSKIETMDFNSSKISEDYDLFDWSDKTNYKSIKEDTIEKQDNKIFKFIHIEGSHVPFNLNEKVENVSHGTYEQKLGTSLTIIEAYINKLKENGIYDNAVIIIMADHGYSLKGRPTERVNPLLMIKGIDEHHDMIRSDKPISFADLNSAYVDLLDGKKSNEIFSDITEPRERRILIYKYLKENHMTEYIQKGKAWTQKNLIKTGKEYIK